MTTLSNPTVANANKILIVASPSAVAQTAQQTLQGMGDVVLTASTIAAAIQAIQTFQPDLLLITTDLATPAAIGQIQAQYPVPIVYLIPNTNAITIDGMITGQGFGYIWQPSEPAIWRLSINGALARHRTEQQLQQALAQAQAENQQIQQQIAQNLEYLATAAHDLRNPLGVIRSVVEVLNSPDIPLPPERQTRYLQRMQLATENVDQLLSAILIYNYARAGKLDAPPSHLDLVQFCQDQVAQFYGDRPHGDRPQTLDFHPQAASCWSYLNLAMLTHIITPLLNNAMCYSPPDSQVEMRLTWDETTVKLTIQDQGIGIAPENQARIFTPFFREEQVSEIPGAGLGLAIAQVCADRQGGSIQLLPSQSIGSCFLVTLPRDIRPPIECSDP
jgi:signal transduction histidine kinase